jgi:hypothetical protein
MTHRMQNAFSEKLPVNRVSAYLRKVDIKSMKLLVKMEDS